MTEDEKQALAALECLLDMTDQSDWKLMHMTVRSDVQAGKYSSDFESDYKMMVDRKLSELSAISQQG